MLSRTFAYAQGHQRLRRLYTQAMEIGEDSDQR